MLTHGRVMLTQAGKPGPRCGDPGRSGSGRAVSLMWSAPTGDGGSFKVQHLAPAETQRLDESEWVEGWAAAHNGRIKTQHQLGSEGIAGQSNGIDYGMSRRSVSVPGGSVAFVGVSYDLC